jgi:hypothetical protein
MTHYTNTDNPVDFPKIDYIWEATMDGGKFKCSSFIIYSKPKR